MKSFLSEADQVAIDFTIDQLRQLWEVAEGMRAWTATHIAAGNLDACPRDAAEHHCILLAKVRDLSELLHDQLEQVGQDRPEQGRVN